MPDLLSQATDLPSFRVVPPSHRLTPAEILAKSTLGDGTPMVGPDGLIVPPGRSFASIVNSATKIFSYRFDEAMRDNFVSARAMRRDAFLRGLIEERILPTINRRWHLAVDDDRDPDQMFVRDGLTRIVENIRDFDMFKRALLDGVWFGRAGCQWAYKRDYENDGLWGLNKWEPIHGDSIQSSFDGTPAVLLDTMTTAWYAANGATYGLNGDLRPTDRGGTALVLQRPYWRDRFAIHMHMREKADYFEGELAGSVQGLGLRGLIYWQYVVRTDALTWMLAYMQAVGQMDLLVFNFPSGDAAAEARQKENANKVIGKAAIVCPRNPLGNWPAVEQIQMNAAGLKAMHELVADYFDRHIERLIVGQSMSAGADKGTGLGGTGRAEFTKATKDEILVYDTNRIDETITHDLIKPLLRYNFRWAKFPVRFKSILPDLDAAEKVNNGSTLIAAGVTIKMDEFREAAGYSRPEDGDEIVGGPPPMAGPAGGPPPDGDMPIFGGGGSPPPDMGGPPPIGPAPMGPAGTPFSDGGAPSTGPAMGFPGGSNTYIPGWGKKRPQPMNMIGFTRYMDVPPSMYDRRDREGEENGHWVTIGAHRSSPKKDKDGKTKGGGGNSGGTPVFIKGGRITKGPGNLTGKNVSDIDSRPGESGSSPPPPPPTSRIRDLAGTAVGQVIADARPAFENHNAMRHPDPRVRERARQISNETALDAMEAETAVAAGDILVRGIDRLRTLLEENPTAATPAPASAPSNVPGPDKPKKKSKAKLQLPEPGFDRSLKENWSALLPDVPVEYAADMIGAMDESTKVKVARTNSGSISITATDPRFFCSRKLFRNSKGELEIHNDLFELESHVPKGTGIGIQVFSEQVKNAAAAGVNKITCYAAGSGGGGHYNGYYTWARFGYDWPLESYHKSAYKARFGVEVSTVQDIMKTEGGRAWWKINGSGSQDATFDLTPGSRSMKIMEAYLQAKQSQRSQTSAPTMSSRSTTPYGNSTQWNPNLTGAQSRQETVYRRESLPLEYSEPHKFCSTQVNLSGIPAIKLLEYAWMVREDHLADDGREANPHVTLRYGLHDPDPDPAARLIAGSGPIRLRLGKVSVFRGADNGKDYDVLKVDVDSKDMLWLNKKLGKLKSTDTFKYSPHATIAYVKAGLGDWYAKQMPPLDLEFTADAVVFSDTRKNKTILPLEEPPTTYARPMPADYVTDALGNEHKDAGPGGGQFTPKGSSGSSRSDSGTPSPTAPPGPALKPPRGHKESVEYPSPSGSAPATGRISLRDRQSFSESLVAAVAGNYNMSMGEQKKRIEACKRVVEIMPDAALKRMAENGTLKTIVSCVDVKEVGRVWEGDSERPSGNDVAVAGFYAPDKASITIDGGDTRGILSHEIAHAVDYGEWGYELSDSDEFRYAWSQEIKGGRLSDYAATEPVEGFAEFCRFLWGNDNGHKYAKDMFPMTYNYFQRVGLVDARSEMMGAPPPSASDLAGGPSEWDSVDFFPDDAK